MERWYTAREVAERIGMSVRYVQREAQAGRLRGRLIGVGPRPALRFRGVDIEDWLQTCTRERGIPRDTGAR